MKVLKIRKKWTAISMILLFSFYIGAVGYPLDQAEKNKEKPPAAVESKAMEAQTETGIDSSLTQVPREAKNKIMSYNVVEKPGVKKKKKFPVLLVVGGAVVVGVLVYFLLIKKKKPTYTLTVTKGEGVNGTPAAGTYTYKEGETVSYNYSLQQGYTDLTVLLDGTAVSANGTITMDGDHALVAATTELGSISVKSTPAAASIYLDDSDTGKKTDTVLDNIMPGTYTLTLKKSGYWNYETTVVVESGKQSQVSTTLERGVTMDWIEIPAGEFKMGDNFNEGVRDERPVHTVYLDDYYIGKYEVTFEQYDLFCEDTGRAKPSDEGWGRGTRPVINVSWYDAEAFCEWLSNKTGENIHLPTEAQWEKAARGTDQRRYPWGNTAPDCTLANYKICGQKTKPVGTLPAGVSPYGVHNMAGNVWEWTRDWYEKWYYQDSPYKNPQGPAAGTLKTRRAGCIYAIDEVMRTANRRVMDPNSSHDGGGFRVAKE